MSYQIINKLIFYNLKSCLSPSFSRSINKTILSFLFLPLLLCAFFSAPCAALAQAPGTILTLAGNGTAGFAGDGGPAASAQLAFPESVAVSVWGDVFISDSGNHRARRTNLDGALIFTAAGTGAPGLSGDLGPAAAAQIEQPEGVFTDALGHLFIVDYGNSRLRRVTPTGRITTLAGTGKGYTGDNIPANAAAFRSPTGGTVDLNGNLYVADTQNFRIRKIGPDGMVTTVAGNGTQGYSGDGGPATLAQLGYPTDVSVDAQGSLYVADSQNHVVRKVDPAGAITTVAGIGTAGYLGDLGPAALAALDTPTDVVVDSSGNLFIADSFNHAVRKVDPAGIISTIAGTGIAGYSGDVGLGTAAQLNVPVGVDLDAAGSLYIADNENHAVRKVIFIAAPAIPPGVFLPGSGDVNRDNSVDVQDAVRVLRSIVGQGDLSPEEARAADENMDGTVDIQDAVLILRDAVGLP
jgi:sugar lactone lactonase YvrE